MKENNILSFTQSLENTKTYRHEYSMSDNLRQELLSHVYLKFVHNIIAQFHDANGDALDNFINEHNVTKEKELTVRGLGFWTQILYNIQHDPDHTILSDFERDNADYFNKWPILRSWLQEWRNVQPSFYYIYEPFGGNAHVAIDILTETPLEIFYPVPSFTMPQEKSIVTGILLPFCDGLYFPLTDLYPFDMDVRDDIIRHARPIYDQLNHEPNHLERFLLTFSSLLRLEHLIRHNHAT
ncbi:hypothetical protein ABID56_001265 [Alkalibacillus flavidus]|uniref:Uncharacterized protein n=1 Tax=Alkalibacillus flavidus TaxID=546021 RepID=A0ABV2KUD0_9BACI